MGWAAQEAGHCHPERGAPTAARGAAVTFMITAAASRVEAFAAFGADDFAFEFTSRLRRLRPVTGVTLSGSGSCLNERSL